MAVSELPGNPNAVWTVKTNIAGMWQRGVGGVEGKGVCVCVREREEEEEKQEDWE